MKLQNCQGNPSVRLSVKMATKDALENLDTQENIKKDSNRYFAEKVWKILNFISQIYGLNIWESGVLDRYVPG